MANAYLQGVEISASQFLDIFHHYDNDGNLFPHFVDFMNWNIFGEEKKLGLFLPPALQLVYKSLFTIICLMYLT